MEIALLYNNFTTDNNTLVNLFVLMVARKLDFIHLKIKMKIARLERKCGLIERKGVERMARMM